MRNSYEYEGTTCAEGINQQPELSRQNQCADALNVWAPGGKVEKRPGYQGTNARYLGYTTTALNGDIVIKEDPIGTFTDTYDLGSLPVGSRWYIGFTTVIDADDYALGLSVAASAANSNAIWHKLEYWNGTTWANLPFYDSSGVLVGPVEISFVWPNDMAETTVNSHTGYFFRFTLNSVNGTVGYDATSVLTNDTSALVPAAGTALHFFTIAQFPFTKLAVKGLTPNGSYTTVNTGPDFSTVAVSYSLSTIDMFLQDEPASVAVIPDAEELYINYNRQPFVIKAYPVTADNVLATVETDPSVVGTGDGQPFDFNMVAMLGTWPRAKYIAYFRNELWSANLDDGGDYTVRWSAGAPYNRVWPSANYENLVEDDNSPITALHGFDQHMMVFKNDSIWRMVFVEESAIGQSTYAPERAVAGIGCVSNSSIQLIQGMLVFLSEDGIYGFDGVQATKLTLDLRPKIGTGADRLKDTIARITPGRRPYAVSAHWRKHSMYLLALSVNGSNTNNLVIAWDYKNDTWWLWDNIEAQTWMSDEDSADNEHLYFVDSKGRICEFGVGKTDHGGTIESYIVTQRMAQGAYKKRARSVEVTSTNKTRGITVELIGNDEPSGTEGTVALTDTEESEYGTAVYSTDSYTPERRRRRRLMFNKAVDWVQVKVSHSEANTPFTLQDVAVGYVPLGRR